MIFRQKRQRILLEKGISVEKYAYKRQPYSIYPTDYEWKNPGMYSSAALFNLFQSGVPACYLLI